MKTEYTDPSGDTLIDRMKQRILQVFHVDYVKITDESHLHAGHKGSNGGGHFHILIVSDEFEGQSRIERHKNVMALFKEDIPYPIHALSLKLMTELEYQKEKK